MSFDKSGSEWVLFAYIANEPRMIEIVEGEESPHTITGSYISSLTRDIVEKENNLVGTETDATKIERLRSGMVGADGSTGLLEGATFLPRSMSIRQAGKKSNFGFNYAEGYRKWAADNNVSEAEAKSIRALYLEEAYPGIPEYWEQVEHELEHNNRTLTNCFGRKRRFLDVWGPDLTKAAIAFRPQSTSVDIVNQFGWLKWWDNRHDFQAECLLQVHDELIFQHPMQDMGAATRFAESMKKYLEPTVEYNGHSFKVGTTMKVGLNRGNMTTIALGDITEQELKDWQATL